jgi:4'-phosphopantetheinyl transferase
MRSAHRSRSPSPPVAYSDRWEPPQRWPMLRRDQVHVWHIPLDLPPARVPDLRALLDTSERERMRQLHHPAEQDRYAAAHAATRLILARYLAVQADVIAYRRGPYGKPALLTSDLPRAEFSLTHSHALALLAVRLGQPVGVDAEWLRPDLELDLIAEQLFSPSEQAALGQLSGSQRIRGFFNCWARKEAYLKGRGTGLSSAPQRFTVSPTADVCTIAASVSGDDAGEPIPPWVVQNLDAGANYAAAVASAGTDWQLRRLGWSWELPATVTSEQPVA